MVSTPARYRSVQNQGKNQREVFDMIVFVILILQGLAYIEHTKLHPRPSNIITFQFPSGDALAEPDNDHLEAGIVFV